MKSSVDVNGADLLITSLELAPGSSRALDGRIAVSLWGGDIVWVRSTDRRELFPVHRITSSSVDGRHDSVVPLYTADLEAALSLVPKDALLQVRQLWNGDDGRSWQASLHVYSEPPRQWVTCLDGTADCAAIAICIAAVRAHVQAATSRVCGSDV